MNIIANNCIGGFIYKYSNQPYGNPFIWTALYGTSLETIIFNYDSINFNDVWLHDVNGKRNYNLVIDNKLDCKFWSHYKYDPTTEVPEKRGDSIYIKHVEDFILNTYRKRLQRMTMPPIFILHWWIGMSTGTADYWKTSPPKNDFIYFSNFIHRPTKYKLLILHPYKEVGDMKFNKTLCIYDELCLFPKRSPACIAKKRISDIMQYINETDT